MRTGDEDKPNIEAKGGVMKLKPEIEKALEILRQVAEYEPGGLAALALLREELERLTELAEEWKDNYADAQGDAACDKAQAEAFATLAREQKARAEKAEKREKEPCP